MLFRLEALEAQRERARGAVLVTRPLSFSVLTVGAVVAAIALVVFFTFGEYTKRNRIVGFTQPDKGAIKLIAPAAGIVTERRVKEGERVAAGQILFVVSGERIAAAGASEATAQGSHAAAIAQLKLRKRSLQDEEGQQARLVQKEQQQLEKRLADIGLEMSQLDREIGTQKRRVQLATDKYRRFADLQKENFVSAAAVSERQEEIIEQQGRMQALERSRLQLVRESSQVASELAQIPLKADRERGQLQRDVSALDQDLALAEAQRQMVITAPAPGVVTGILAEPGQTVSTAPMATLLPDNATLEAVLFAPSRSAGFIEPGQSVRVRYQSYPYQKFGQYDGTVVQVSRAALTPSELPQLIAGQGLQAEPMYRVTVRLAQQAITAYGQQQPLTAGMQLEADVMQDRRKLIEWVFEPLYSLRGKW